MWGDVQRAYYCPPFDPYMIQGAAGFAVAAKEAQLEHIVSLAQWLASPSHPSLMTRQHLLAAELANRGLLREAWPYQCWNSKKERFIVPQLWFFMSITFSFIAWGIVTARYIWPELRLRQRAEALRPLLCSEGIPKRSLGLHPVTKATRSPSFRIFVPKAAFICQCR